MGYLLAFLFFAALCLVVYHAVKWARIIFVLEDDLAEAIAIHERTIETLEAIKLKAQKQVQNQQNKQQLKLQLTSS